MTVLQVLNFGGEVPSASARTLPPGSARTARNLHPRVGEFRPLNEALFKATVAVGSKALHRLERKADGTFAEDMSTGWLAYPQVMSFAKGQINDDLTGRVYYSFDSGTETPPRVMDAGINPTRDGLAVAAAVDKPLGIPAPGKPTVAALIGEEFTPDEYNDLVALKTREVETVIRKNAVFTLLGSALASNSTPGYMDIAVTASATTVTPGTTNTTTGAVEVAGGGVVTALRPEVVAVPSNYVLSVNPTLGLMAHGPATLSPSALFILVATYRTFTFKGTTYVTDTVTSQYKADKSFTL